MAQALYRKYRSKQLSEIIGQEHITSTLGQAIKRGKISHAYLFTGPRGVGKTSIARILAHQINHLAYDGSPHLDIIEIDAASNRRIDEVRDLRDKVYIAPTSAQYKVYIIDEVHMLTREAFNALLKTLEEPPAHVVFILATTDAHKLPETIISRTQRFSFKPVPSGKVAAHLADIAKSEGIDASPEALELLAQHGEGSLRDSISLLDQAGSHGKKLELHELQLLLGIPPTEAIEQLVGTLANTSSPGAVIEKLAVLYDQGFTAAVIAKQMAKLVRSQLSSRALKLPLEQALQLLGLLLEVPAAHQPERYLEICLLQFTSVPTTPLSTRKTVTHDGQMPQPARPVVKESIPEGQATSGTATKQKPEISKTASQAESLTAQNGVSDQSLWPQVLGALKQKHNTLYGVVRMAEPDFSKDGIIKLGFSFAFHQKRINEPANRQLLVGIIKALTGKTVVIECVHNKTARVPKITVPAPSTASLPEDLSAINTIFGGGEVL